MPEKLFAEVVVDITAKKLNKIFHYSIPERLRERLAPGVRVVVPFGRRTVGGYLLGFSETADVLQTKEIIDVLDEEPLLSADLMHLAEWMSEKYMCSKADAIRVMIPARTKGSEKYISVSGNNDLFHEEKVNLLKAKEFEIFKYIYEKGIVSSKELSGHFGAKATAMILKKLNGLGLIIYTGEVDGINGPRLVQTVKTDAAGAELETIIEGLSKSPKKASVLRIAATRGAMPVTELARLAGTTPSTVRELIKKGFLISGTSEIRRDPYGSKEFKETYPLQLTQSQKVVYKEIASAVASGQYQAFLLHGVTGSGKTEVYLQAIDYCLRKGRQAIVLVPEIALTPQMIERFKGRFGDLVAVLHSRLSAGERYDEWSRIKTNKVKVVVGARSAVFAPFDNPGLIIIDEEHEASYKQEDNPKYHARDVAAARAQACGSVVVLGSATPSIESYSRAKAGKYRLLTMGERVLGRPMPVVKVIDLREEIQAGNRSIFSRSLVDSMSTVLTRGEQAILFLNRRGYSTFVVCRECGLVMNCPKCSITLTHHAAENILRCHYCDYRRKAPDICPKCSSRSIRHFGIGTQRVEEEVLKLFPEAKVARMDMDTTTTKGSHERILGDFKKGRIDILIGTQMIAKGLDFPGVTLVGVVTADTALNLPDFRAAERTFQLLTQVAGRAGRGDTPGEVLVQTYSPDHYSVVNAQNHDYLSFYNEEIKIRKAFEYPPYSLLVRILIYGNEENSVIRGSQVLAYELEQILSLCKIGIDQPLLGPAPAPLSKLRDRFRWQICIKGKQGKNTRSIVKEAVAKAMDGQLFVNLGVSIDVDPVSMM